MSIKYLNQHFKQTAPTMQAQRGFTVLELVIALLLGVLLVAAGISLFMSSQRTALLQQQQGTMQENSIFGLSLLLQDLRHTNHNMATQNMGWHTANTGLILTAQQLPSHLNLSAEQQQLLLSWHNVSQGVYVQQSDVLSIQYAPDYVEIDQNQDGTIERVETSATDCEGMTLTPDKEQGLLTKYVLVQRYFVQKVANGSPVRYALYCDAARYAQQNATHI
ncbi:MAG: hypothetical protein Q4D05_03845, partial [Acinetobacter sp.]|nr:hypothetical protein [Acinetobacter sp.]